VRHRRVIGVASMTATLVSDMRVLVTNDDGVEAPGLHALACALRADGHDVVVVAPSGERSGSGAAIGRLHRAGPIAWKAVEWPDLPGVPIHSVDVPPAAAVYAGCVGAFGPRPDVVASGINPGLNYGHLVLHSGTVGAALTARMLGVSGVAVSLAWGDDQHWSTAATLAADAVEWLDTQAGAPMVVNLSVPNVELTEVRGVRDARLHPFNERWKARTESGELHLEYDGHASEPEPDTDFALVKAGYAAVTLLDGIATVPGSGVTAARSIARALDTRVLRRGVA
jgi:5'-nucleotidase